MAIDPTMCGFVLDSKDWMVTGRGVPEEQNNKKGVGQWKQRERDRQGSDASVITPRRGLQVLLG